MLEYVFFVYTDNDVHYLGNFKSCNQAHEYFDTCHRFNYPKWSTSCVMQEYIYLPKDFVPVYPEGCSKD